MLPGPGEITLDSDRITEYEKEPIQTAQRPHRSRWARGRRKPLRRGRNLPGPLETPDFVTRREPVQDEWKFLDLRGRDVPHRQSYVAAYRPALVVDGQVELVTDGGKGEGREL